MLKHFSLITLIAIGWLPGFSCGWQPEFILSDAKFQNDLKNGLDTMTKYKIGIYVFRDYISKNNIYF